MQFRKCISFFRLGLKPIVIRPITIGGAMSCPMHLVHTGFSSEIGTKLRESAVGQAGGSCYSRAALSSNDSKTLYIPSSAPFRTQCVRPPLPSDRAAAASSLRGSRADVDGGRESSPFCLRPASQARRVIFCSSGRKGNGIIAVFGVLG